MTHCYESASRWMMRIFAFVPRQGSALDLAVRDLLANKDQLGEELKAALGDIPVEVSSYPAGVEALVTANPEG